MQDKYFFIDCCSDFDSPPDLFLYFWDEQNQKLNVKRIICPETLSSYTRMKKSFLRSGVQRHLNLIIECVYPKLVSHVLSWHHYPLWGISGGDQAFLLISIQFESWAFFFIENFPVWLYTNVWIQQSVFFFSEIIISVQSWYKLAIVLVILTSITTLGPIL